MEIKIGDKVKLKECNKISSRYSRHFAGKIVTIADIQKEYFTIQEDVSGSWLPQSLIALEWKTLFNHGDTVLIKDANGIITETIFKGWAIDGEPITESNNTVYQICKQAGEWYYVPKPLPLPKIEAGDLVMLRDIDDLRNNRMTNSTEILGLRHSIIQLQEQCGRYQEQIKFLKLRVERLSFELLTLNKKTQQAVPELKENIQSERDNTSFDEFMRALKGYKPEEKDEL